MIRSAKVSDEIQSRLAKMLGSSDPEEVAVAVEAIEDYASKSIPKDLIVSGPYAARMSLNTPIKLLLTSI